MSDVHAGSCLCGAVRFRIEGDFDAFFLCHCAHCRKDTGSAHAANLFSSSARLIWLAGEAAVTSYQLPSTRHARSFCSVCGSALPHQAAGDPMLAVPAGSLDTVLGRKPNAHIFVSSRAAWDDTLEALPSFPTFPS